MPRSAPQRLIAQEEVSPLTSSTRAAAGSARCQSVPISRRTPALHDHDAYDNPILSRRSASPVSRRIRFTSLPAINDDGYNSDSSLQTDDTRATDSTISELFDLEERYIHEAPEGEPGRPRCGGYSILEKLLSTGMSVSDVRELEVDQTMLSLCLRSLIN